MDFFEVIRNRRSVREFDGERMVHSKDIETCLEAARLAPSSTNAQPWRFLVVRSPKVRAALVEAGYNQPCLEQAPVITVLLGDREVFKKRLRRAKELADVGALTQDVLAAMEEKYREKSPAEVGDAVIRINCMLAGEHYALAAAALDLGCCWVGLFDDERVGAALKLDARYNFPVALLPTGYPKSALPPPRPRYGLSDIAWKDEIGRPWIEGS